MTKIIFLILLIVCGIFLIVAGSWITLKVLTIGLERHEKVECQQWEEASKYYPNWYATDWQKLQCLNYGIELK